MKKDHRFAGMSSILVTEAKSSVAVFFEQFFIECFEVKCLGMSGPEDKVVGKLSLTFSIHFDNGA